MSQTTVPTNGERRDKRSGRFEQEFTDDEFVRAIDEIGGGGTGDIAHEVGCKHNTAYKRLRKLHEHGRVESEKVGNSLRWETTNDDVRDAILSELQARQVVKTSILDEELEGYSENEIRDELYNMVEDGIVEQLKGDGDGVWELLD